jgi:hypothetical protein
MVKVDLKGIAKATAKGKTYARFARLETRRVSGTGSKRSHPSALLQVKRLRQL